MTPVLQLRGIFRSFGQTQALNGVDFALQAGEVHGLLGENGAGKSTLMNIVFGMISPDEGQIIVDGDSHHRMTPQSASALGIGMVHQHFKLVDDFTVAENIALGSPDWQEALSQAKGTRLRGLIGQTGLHVDPAARVESLPVGIRQRVEILKALFRGSRVLILDEPTAVLTPRETEELFAAIRRLRDNGTSVIIITHKLREALAISDVITVLRAGERVLTRGAAETDEAEIARAMVGGGVDHPEASGASNVDASETLMSMVGVSASSANSAIEHICMDVRAGEIVGVAGVEGNGQGALLETAAGAIAPAEGTVHLAGEDITDYGVAQRIRRGIAVIPADRQSQALILEFSLTENVLLGLWPLEGYRSAAFVRLSRVEQATREIIKSYGIHGARPSTPATALSGGNQQRLVVGRDLAARPRVLIAANPARGLDIGAAAYVHQQLRQHCSNGGAVILISTDLDEILALSTRIAVLYAGRIAGWFNPNDSREAIGLCMTGGNPQVLS